MSSEMKCVYCAVRTKFLEAFLKLRKATTSFFLSVCLSIRMEKFGSHCMYFDKTFSFLKALSRKFKLDYNLTRITDTLHEDVYTFMTISL